MEKKFKKVDLEFRKSAVDLTDLALGILVLGVVVSVGAILLTTYRDNRLTSLDTTSVVNETVSPSSGVFTLSNTWVKSISEVTNASGAGLIINSGNYTTAISTIDGTGTLSFPNSEYNVSDLNVSYDYYDTTGQDWALANNASTGVGEFGNWFTILVIVGVASVILSLIFMAFSGNRGPDGIGGSY